MARKIAAVFVDPLVAGFWGVLLAISSLALGTYTLFRSRHLPPWQRSAVASIGGAVFALAVWLLYRYSRFLSQRTSEPRLLTGDYQESEKLTSLAMRKLMTRQDSRIGVCRVAKALRERTVALAGLPGPKYNRIFGLTDVLTAKDPHRVARTWADTYGPLVKIRILFFHVRLAHMLLRKHPILSMFQTDEGENVQAVMVTDPALAMHVLYSPLFDKFQFLYSFLDPVRLHLYSAACWHTKSLLLLHVW